VYYQRKQYGRAAADFSRGLKLQPDCARMLRRRAAAYLCLGEIKLSIDDCNLALQMDPSAESYACRASVWLDHGDLQRCRADVEAAVKLDPDAGQCVRRELARITGSERSVP
jgi:tetratricopeptide (TPR) repeat protein